MTSLIDPVIADLLDRLTNTLHKEIEERINASEFKAEYPQRLASCLGMLEILKRNLSGLSHVKGMQITLDGQTQFLAVTDAEYARQHLVDSHAHFVAVLDLRTMLEEQYGGIAAMTFLG